MNNTKIIVSLTIIVLPLAVFADNSPPSRQVNQKPNVLFIAVEDLND